MSSSIEMLNPNAERVSSLESLIINTTAATGLQNVLKTNLGPKGTLKMLVGGAGQIKLTKDGNTLLHEMQIQHPTATLIARTATATDDSVGDGTTSTVLFTGELMKQAARVIQEGTHPRLVVKGFEEGKKKLLEILGKISQKFPDIKQDRELLLSVCRSVLGTKLKKELVDKLVEVVVEAVLVIWREGKEIDLHMVEIMHMKHNFDFDSRLVKGLVLDHGARHPGMPKKMSRVHILILNVSLEYEKTEISSNFVYKNAEEREKLVAAERKFTDEKVQKIIDFKNEVKENYREQINKGEEFSFMVINQKGIDPISLDMFAKEGILGLRRAKRRNMERLSLACGGYQVNNVDDLSEECLGYADQVYEQILEEEKYTFVEGVRHPHSCTILVQGQNEHTIAMVKDGLRDALRSVRNAIEGKELSPGAGATEIAAYCELQKWMESKECELKGKVKLGCKAFVESLLVIPGTLAANSGYDQQDTVLKLIEEYREKGIAVGVDVETGESLSAVTSGVWDNLRVKESVFHLSASLASQLLLVDEIMKAGRGSRPKAPGVMN
eukprot:snap_masked-scaffold_26-processed-gene-4.54-mRNA-1 protein AED:0.01 eAED:0.01 QI:0/-1/0/1/-1/1/1/0/553